MFRARLESSRNPAKRSRGRPSRRLLLEPLEDRRLLAISGDLTGGILNFTGDGGANELRIASTGPNGYSLTSSTDNISITDSGGALTIVGNNTGNVTITAPGAAVTSIAIDLLNGADTVALDGLTNNAAASLTSLAVNDAGAAGIDAVSLGGDFEIDGNLTLAGVETVLLAATSTIDTEQGGNSNAGNVDFGTAVVSADNTNRDLTIDAGTGGGFTAGIVKLGTFSNAPGPQFVRNLTIVAGATTQISSDIHTTGNQTYSAPVRVAGNATLTAANVTFASTLDDDGIGGTPSNLIIDTVGGGLTSFAAAVGATSPLSSLMTNADGTTQINGGSVTTSGGQIYNDPVIVNSAATHLTTLTGQDIAIAATSKLNGAAAGESVKIAATGTINLGGPVGDVQPLNKLTLQAGGAVTQSAKMIGAGLELLGAGPFTLTNAANDFATLAAATAGVINYVDANALSVGSVNTVGVNTGGSDLTLTTLGLLSIANNITAAGNTVDINAAGVTEVGGVISSDKLRLQGTGNFSLAGNNAVGTLAANVTGALSYKDVDALTIGSVTANAVTTNGVNTNGNDVTLIVGGLLTISNDITATGKTVDITAAGVSEAGGAIASDKLRLQGTGTFTLTANNAVATLAANVTGDLSYTDLDALTVGTVTTVGINTGASNVTLITGGPLTINSDITATSKTVDITAAGVTEAGGAIASDKLRLLGAGVFTLTGNNSVGTLAANVMGPLSYSDIDALTIGSITANAVTTSGITASATVDVTTGGPLTVAANIIAGGAVQLNATESAAADNDVVVESGVTVQSTAAIQLNAGDNITALGTAKFIAATTLTLQIDVGNADPAAGQSLDIANAATIIASAGAFLIGGSDNDTFHFPSQAGSTLNVMAGAGNDQITVVNQNFDGVGRLVTIDGQADGDLTNPTQTATIRQGGTTFISPPAKRPYFVPNTAVVSIADKVFWDDTAATHHDAIYTIAAADVIRNGFTTLHYANVELLNLKTGIGNDDVIANMATGPLPSIVQVHNFGGPDNRFQVQGTFGPDNISVGDIGTSLAISSGPLRASFELAGIQRQWIRGGGGNDTIDNISKVPGLLDGGIGNDTINSIVDIGNSSIFIAGKISSSTIKNVTLALGNLGQDKLFVGSGNADVVTPAGSVAAALKAFPDRGITFLIGDYKADATLTKLIPVVAGGQPGDRYASSTNKFLHGFVALKDTAPVLGIFRFGAGDVIKFSSTIAWLKAQIFVKASLDQLVKFPLSKQLAAYTKPVGPSGEAEGADDFSADIASPPPAMIPTTATSAVAAIHDSALLYFLAGSGTPTNRRRR